MSNSDVEKFLSGNGLAFHDRGGGKVSVYFYKNADVIEPMEWEERRNFKHEVGRALFDKLPAAATGIIYDNVSTEFSRDTGELSVVFSGVSDVDALREALKKIGMEVTVPTPVQTGDVSRDKVRAYWAEESLVSNKSLGTQRMRVPKVKDVAIQEMGRNSVFITVSGVSPPEGLSIEKVTQYRQKVARQILTRMADNRTEPSFFYRDAKSEFHGKTGEVGMLMTHVSDVQHLQANLKAAGIKVSTPSEEQVFSPPPPEQDRFLKQVQADLRESLVVNQELGVNESQEKGAVKFAVDTYFREIGVGFYDHGYGRVSVFLNKTNVVTRDVVSGGAKALRELRQYMGRELLNTLPDGQQLFGGAHSNVSEGTGEVEVIFQAVGDSEELRNSLESSGVKVMDAAREQYSIYLEEIEKMVNPKSLVGNKELGTKTPCELAAADEVSVQNIEDDSVFVTVEKVLPLTSFKKSGDGLLYHKAMGRKLMDALGGDSVGTIFEDALPMVNISSGRSGVHFLGVENVEALITKLTSNGVNVVDPKVELTDEHVDKIIDKTDDIVGQVLLERMSAIGKKAIEDDRFSMPEGFGFNPQLGREVPAEGSAVGKAILSLEEMAGKTEPGASMCPDGADVERTKMKGKGKGKGGEDLSGMP